MPRSWRSFVCAVAIAGAAGSARPLSTSAIQTQEADAVVKAWAVLFQGIAALRKYVASGELSAVHSEDGPIASAVSLLSGDLTAVQPELRNDLQLKLLAFGRTVGDLHATADAFDQSKAEALLTHVLTQSEALQAPYRKDTLTAARALAERYTCPMHPDVRGQETQRCPRCGMALDQPVRIPLHHSGGTVATKTVDATIRITPNLPSGQPVDGVLTLTSFGQPVLITDLRIVHTERIHLLVIDPTLTDYHHLHPRPTNTPGEYAFTFVPRRSGLYRAWADVRTTATGFQEYAIADIVLGQKADEPAIERSATLHAESDGLRFDLALDRSRVKAGEPARATVRVADGTGAPFRALEPVMGTFAHLVGFHEDYKTVLHTHPGASRALVPEDRGGPQLEFQLYATRAGFYRLFLQVQVGGTSRFAAFGLQVAPGE